MKRFFPPGLAAALLILAAGSAFAETTVDRSREGYVVFVPDPPANPLAGRPPVLVCLPGWNIRALADLDNWKSQARRYGFVVVDINLDYGAIQEGEAVKAAQDWIGSTVRKAAAEYGADPDRVYLGGTSNGGMLAIALSLKFPRAYRAVGALGGGSIHTAWVADEELKNAWGQRYYFIQGETDQVVPFPRHQETLRELGRNGALLDYIIYPYAGHSLPERAYEEMGSWFREVDDATRPRNRWKPRGKDFLKQKLRHIKHVLLANRGGYFFASKIMRVRRALFR